MGAVAAGWRAQHTRAEAWSRNTRDNRHSDELGFARCGIGTTRRLVTAQELGNRASPYREGDPGEPERIRRSGSAQASAAIHVDDCARHVARGGGGQEHGYPRDLLRVGESTEGTVVRHVTLAP